jgi:hypothetical protein
MERAVAIKKLGKLLGKSLGYRVDPDAPSAEERAEAKQQLPALNAAKQQAGEAMEARRTAILASDAEYQRLVETYRIARKNSAAALSIVGRYRVTVGTSGDLFFHVKAQGDSWEDVITKLNGRRA